MNLKVEVRSDGGRTVVSGYAAVFNSFFDELGYREIIKPGAFARALQQSQDVRGLFNHDPNHVLGRTRSGTMRLYEDETGLRYEIDPPETTTARDVVESLKRGDISGSSFSFTVAPGGETWRSEGDQYIRELTDLDLYDVGPVTFPAYTATTSEAVQRSLDKLKEASQVKPDLNTVRLNDKKINIRKESK